MANSLKNIEISGRKIRFPGLVLPALVLLMLTPDIVNAQVEDKLRLTVGGFAIYRYDSLISLTETNVGVGISFSPEDTLGMKSEQTVFRSDGRYRFSDKHALTFSWYRISSDGARVLQDDIEWIDLGGNPVVIPAGTGVTSTLDYDIFKLGYLWSFYHSDKVELSAGAGIHMTKVAIALNANTTSSGVGARRADTAVPLPVLSFKIDYSITPKTNWYLQSELFAISLGDWDGTYTDTQLGIEYRAFEHVGFGLGVGGNALKIVEESGNVRFDFDNRISGVHLFVAGYF